MPVLSLISPSSPKQLDMVSLRQESFGKEEETRTLKPFAETLRVRIPPGKAGPAGEEGQALQRSRFPLGGSGTQP